jgi:hypothetical protein
MSIPFDPPGLDISVSSLVSRFYLTWSLVFLLVYILWLCCWDSPPARVLETPTFDAIYLVIGRGLSLALAGRQRRFGAGL